MNIMHKIRERSDTGALARRTVTAAAIWCLGILFLYVSVVSETEVREKLADADGIIRAAAKVNASMSGGDASMSDISDMAAALGIEDKVTQMGASPSGITLSISGIDTETFAKMVKYISEKGFPVKSAEVRAMAAKGKRELTVSFVIGGENDGDRKDN